MRGEGNTTWAVHDHLRYSTLVNGISLVADTNLNARRLKPKLGKHAYRVQSIVEMTKKNFAVVDVSADAQSAKGSEKGASSHASPGTN